MPRSPPQDHSTAENRSRTRIPNGSGHPSVSDSTRSIRRCSCTPLSFDAVVHLFRASITYTYVYIVLGSWPLMYLRSMESNVNTRGSRSLRIHYARGVWGRSRTSNPCRWTSLLDDVTRKCYTTLAGVGLCLLAGMYIVQESYEVIPETLGYIVMIVSVEALLSTFATLAYIPLVKTSLPAMRTKLNCLSNQWLMRVAKILALPIPALLWCFVLTAISAAFYGTQSRVPMLQVPMTPGDVYLRGVTSHRGAHHHEEPDRTQSDQEPLLLTANHSFPRSSRIVVCIAIALVTIRFIYVVYSLVRLHNALSEIRITPSLLDSTDMDDNENSTDTLTGIPLQNIVVHGTRGASALPANAVPGLSLVMAASADDTSNLEVNDKKLKRRSAPKSDEETMDASV
ncbi:hypothetical protein BC629DRAFT_1460181 [Irpex lacteus]|nr:hypothetical protein BC629DRAFT_1460181 [Irpex lacteus]